MEEILASIRRIISEESPSKPAPAEQDILSSIKRIVSEDAQRKPANAEANAPEGVLVLTQDMVQRPGGQSVASQAPLNELIPGVPVIPERNSLQTPPMSRQAAPRQMAPAPRQMPAAQPQQQAQPPQHFQTTPVMQGMPPPATQAQVQQQFRTAPTMQAVSSMQAAPSMSSMQAMGQSVNSVSPQAQQFQTGTQEGAPVMPRSAPVMSPATREPSGTSMGAPNLTTLHQAQPIGRSAQIEPGLVSPNAEAGAVAAFHQLHSLTRANVNRHIGGLLVEDLVRQVMEPVLRNWLEQHLAQIVEQIVKQEVERLITKANL